MARTWIRQIDKTYVAQHILDMDANIMSDVPQEQGYCPSADWPASQVDRFFDDNLVSYQWENAHSLRVRVPVGFTWIVDLY